MTESLRLEWTSGGHTVQPLCQGKVTWSRWHRNASRWGLNVSRERGSTTSLGSLFQWSAALSVRKLFLMLRYQFLCFSLWPLLLILSMDTTEKSLAPSPQPRPLRSLYALVRSCLSLLYTKQAWLCQSVLIRELLTIFVSLRWTLC